MNGHSVESACSIPASYARDIACLMSVRGELLIEEQVEDRPEIAEQLAFALIDNNAPQWLKDKVEAAQNARTSDSKTSSNRK